MCSDVCSEGLESWSASFFLTHITTDRSYVAGKPANKVPTDEWKPLHKHVKGAVHPKKNKKSRGQTTFLEPDSKTTEVAEDFKKHKNATLWSCRNGQL